MAREIDRDERVVLLALGRRLRRLLRPALRVGAARDLAELLARLSAAIEEAGAAGRRLNDARIARRGERGRRPAEQVPPGLARHACHGAYVGAFASLAEVGDMYVETCPEGQVEGMGNEVRGVDRALALHLDGTLWTVEEGGQVHVFRCRG